MSCCKEKNACLICGAELEYYADRHELMTCQMCGKTLLSNTRCRSGHFVCDECHSKKSIESVLEICGEIKSKDPVKIAQRLFENSSVHMHGPEHHVLTGAALLTAYDNSGGGLELEKALVEMTERGMQIPGGSCGFWGGCGAALSAGISFSIITETTPLSVESWGLCSLLTSRILKAMGSIGGPRCCKRTSFLAIREAAEFMNGKLKVKMDISEDIKCSFFRSNRECIRKRCPFFPSETE